MKKNRNLIFWLVVIIGIFAFSHFTEPTKPVNEIIFSDLLTKIKNKEVKEVEIKGNTITGKLNNDEQFTTLIIGYDKLIDELTENDVNIKIAKISTTKGRFFSELLSWSPLLIWGVFCYFFLRSSGGAGGALKFGKSKAKLLEMKGKITFKDVAGIDEAKNELKELVDFLKDPEKYNEIGAKIPRGCLLIGAPGTGKTLLARAIAGEANVPFYFISGSDFVEMFVGVGASRVRDMFEEAKKNAPCLIFIDEIDAVGRQRGVGVGGGNDEREQTLNQLLVEMDGFEGNEGVIVIAATNRDDVLDKALLRPGRFDRQIRVQLPDVKGREEILQVHAKKVKIAPNVDLKSIAKMTSGFSGAELANVINEAGLLAARNNKKVITNDDIEEATERVIVGLKNQSKIMSEEERRLTAYHEGGHAIVALYCKNSNPIHKATIISRGSAGGYVSRLPEYDKYYNTKAEIFENIAIAMGGRVAEEIIFGEDKITSGASSDIQMATNYAKNMVVAWGMSDEVGPINYVENIKGNGWGLEATSDATLNVINSEIKKIITKAKEKAAKILMDHAEQLQIIADALLKYETLTGDEIKDLVAGKEIITKKEEEIKSSSLLTKIIEKNKNVNNNLEENENNNNKEEKNGAKE